MGKPTPSGLLANFIAQITPVFLESMRLIAIHEPEKPLAALDNFFLGVPIVACAVHTPYRRDGPEAAMVMGRSEAPEHHSNYEAQTELARSQ
jgi:hypothetical protein